MKFGVFDHIDANGMPLAEQYAQRLAFVELYETLGFHCYHLAEHHATRLGMASSSSVFLSAVAQRTRTLKFGPLVYLLPLYHPLRLLEEIGMLDQLGGGRLQLGVGPGGQVAEHSRFGLAAEDVRPMFDEAFEVLVKGLTSETLEHEGRYYKIPPTPMLIKPIQQPHPPLWYGTSAPERGAWAAKYRINLVSLLPNSRTRQIADALKEAWANTGQPEGERPFVGLSRLPIIADSDAEARQLAERIWPGFARSFNWLVNWLGREPFPIPGDFAGAEAMGIAFAGSPETARQWVQQMRDEAGIDYLAVELVFGELTTEEATRSIELFAREVMPAFAE